MDWAPKDNDELIRFLQEYQQISGQYGQDPNPYSPEHHYDWYGAFKKHGTLEPPSFEDGQAHWWSEFKALDHPNRFIDGIDTITGRPAKGDNMQLNPELIKMLMMSGPVRDPNDPRIYDRLQQRMQGQPSYQLQDPMQSAPIQPTQPTAPDPETLRMLLQLLQRLQSQQTGQAFGQQTPFMR